MASLQVETVEAPRRQATAELQQKWQRRFFFVLLGLGIVQFVWCYLYRIPSELHLALYERGLERMPFQGRLLLAAPLRWAHGSGLLLMGSARLSRLPAWFPRGAGPDGLFQAAMDCAAVGASCAAATALYKRCSQTMLLPWLVSPLLLVLCGVTYVGLAHHSLRFAYDLPAMAFFSAGLWLIHLDRWRPWQTALFVAVFVAGTINRETTLLLLVFLALAEQGRVGLRTRVVILGLALALVWLGLHAWTVVHFRANPHVASQHLFANLGSLLVPLSWPQLAATLGYMWFPLVVFRNRIPDALLRGWLPGLGVWLVFMSFYGLLVEPRLWGELLPYAACTVTLIAEEILAERLATARHLVQDPSPTAIVRQQKNLSRSAALAES